MSTTRTRKLSELRVIDLQRELKSYDILFDKKELKVSLVEKLRQALISHHQDPETFLFEMPTESKVSPDDYSKLSDESVIQDTNSVDTITSEATNENDKMETDGASNTAGMMSQQQQQQDNSVGEVISKTETLVTTNSALVPLLEEDDDNNLRGKMDTIDLTQIVEEKNKMMNECKNIFATIVTAADDSGENISSQVQDTTSTTKEEKDNPVKLNDDQQNMGQHRLEIVVDDSDDEYGINNQSSKNETNNHQLEQHVLPVLSETQQKDDNLNKEEEITTSQTETTTTTTPSQTFQSTSDIDLASPGEAEGRKQTESETTVQQHDATDNDLNNKAETSTATKTEEALITSVSTPKQQSGKEKESNHVWVSNISNETHASDLKALFSKHGKVLAAKVVSRANSSQWYGYITLQSGEDVDRCITSLHKTQLHGKTIYVEKEALDRIRTSPKRSKAKSATERASSHSQKLHQQTSKSSSHSSQTKEKKPTTSSSVSEQQLKKHTDAEQVKISLNTEKRQDPSNVAIGKQQTTTVNKNDINSRKRSIEQTDEGDTATSKILVDKNQRQQVERKKLATDGAQQPKHHSSRTLSTTSSSNSHHKPRTPTIPTEKSAQVGKVQTNANMKTDRGTIRTAHKDGEKSRSVEAHRNSEKSVVAPDHHKSASNVPVTSANTAKDEQQRSRSHDRRERNDVKSKNTPITAPDLLQTYSSAHIPTTGADKSRHRHSSASQHLHSQQQTTAISHHRHEGANNQKVPGSHGVSHQRKSEKDKHGRSPSSSADNERRVQNELRLRHFQHQELQRKQLLQQQQEEEKIKEQQRRLAEERERMRKEYLDLEREREEMARMKLEMEKEKEQRELERQRQVQELEQKARQIKQQQIQQQKQQQQLQEKQRLQQQKEAKVREENYEQRRTNSNKRPNNSSSSRQQPLQVSTSSHSGSGHVSKSSGGPARNPSSISSSSTSIRDRSADASDYYPQAKRHAYSSSSGSSNTNNDQRLSSHHDQVFRDRVVYREPPSPVTTRTSQRYIDEHPTQQLSSSASSQRYSDPYSRSSMYDGSVHRVSSPPLQTAQQTSQTIIRGPPDSRDSRVLNRNVNIEHQHHNERDYIHQNSVSHSIGGQRSPAPSTTSIRREPLEHWSDRSKPPAREPSYLVDDSHKFIQNQYVPSSSSPQGAWATPSRQQNPEMNVKNAISVDSYSWPPNAGVHQQHLISAQQSLPHHHQQINSDRTRINQRIPNIISSVPTQRSQPVYQQPAGPMHPPPNTYALPLSSQSYPQQTLILQPSSNRQDLRYEQHYVVPQGIPRRY